MTNNILDQAWALRRENRLTEAHEQLSAAIQDARKTGEETFLIKALGKLAHVERDLGNNNRAEAIYTEATALCRKREEPLELAHIIRHHADLLLHMNRITEAEPIYREAIAIYRSTSGADVLDTANALRGLALQREQCNDADEARAIWQEARTLYSHAGINAGVEECDTKLNRLATDEG